MGQNERRVKQGTSNMWLRPKGKNDHTDVKRPGKVSWETALVADFGEWEEKVPS